MIYTSPSIPELNKIFGGFITTTPSEYFFAFETPSKP